MKKRVFGLFLAIEILANLCYSIAAESKTSEPRASLYLDSYAIGVNAKGSGKMSVTFIVYGARTMDKIGAQKIVVEEWDGKEWGNPITYTADSYSNFYATKAAEHTASVTFYGVPGLQYRATLTAYAELNGGSDTGTVTCTPKTCK